MTTEKYLVISQKSSIFANEKEEKQGLLAQLV